MKKPHNPCTNVHFLYPPAVDVPRPDTLGTLLHVLKDAPDRRLDSMQVPPSSNEQTIRGDGNIQLSGAVATRQTISGSNNIQIGAVQLVVNITMDVKR